MFGQQAHHLGVGNVYLQLVGPKRKALLGQWPSYNWGNTMAKSQSNTKATPATTSNAPAATPAATPAAATNPPAWQHAKGKPATATATAFNGQFSYNSRAHGSITGSTLLQRTTVPPRSGATANNQSAWQAVNAMPAGSTATAGQLLGATPLQPYGRNGQAAHLAYAISKGYLVPAK